MSLLRAALQCLPPRECLRLLFLMCVAFEGVVSRNVLCRSQTHSDQKVNFIISGATCPFRMCNRCFHSSIRHTQLTNTPHLLTLGRISVHGGSGPCHQGVAIHMSLLTPHQVMRPQPLCPAWLASKRRALQKLCLFSPTNVAQNSIGHGCTFSVPLCMEWTPLMLTKVPPPKTPPWRFPTVKILESKSQSHPRSAIDQFNFPLIPKGGRSRHQSVW